MAAFASDRRSGWVRFLVVLLCALFIFSTLGAPAARAEALTVGLFTVAAVLSAATAALGFKLANSAEGQATLAKMVQDFKFSATAIGLVLVGSKFNGLIDGVDYIKMQVKAGKTYLDERIFAWCQQWLANNGVYDSGGFQVPEYSYGMDLTFSGCSFDAVLSQVHQEEAKLLLSSLQKHFNLAIDGKLALLSYSTDYRGSFYARIFIYNDVPLGNFKCDIHGDSNYYVSMPASFSYECHGYYLDANIRHGSLNNEIYTENANKVFKSNMFLTYNYWNTSNVIYGISNFGDIKDLSNTTGLSGTDTLGKDVIDLTIDQILEKLKEWAPDWWDAGADSSTNAAAGAKDLPLNMGSDVKTVTGNPALEVDQPLIYTPWFEETLDNLRSGETAGTVTNTATSAADTADKAEAAQGTVEDAQGVVQSLISWGLDYISPDKGLFSRFPLCIPYDAYLLVTAVLGVDAQDLGDIVGQSPGDVSAQIDDGVAVQSDFVPVLSVKHDWTQDGVTTPVEVTIDLRPYDGVIKMIRTLVSVYVIAELIASEYKRIRGS